ncbi:MAG: hypothetical protein QG622_2136 [Actinomycetota bacterium]|nr:hypothetical protein [Actinomycetota bacterium]
MVRREPEGNDAFLGPLAHDPKSPSFVIDVLHVCPHQLGHPHTCRVQNLDQGSVPEGDRRRGWIQGRRRTGRFLRSTRRHGHELRRLLLTQHPGQRSSRLRRAQPQPRIVGRPARPEQPGRETPGARRSAGHAGARGTIHRHRCEPGPQDGKIQELHGWSVRGRRPVAIDGADELHQGPDVPQIGPGGVGRASSFHGEMTFVTAEELLHLIRGPGHAHRLPWDLADHSTPRARTASGEPGVTVDRYSGRAETAATACRAECPADGTAHGASVSPLWPLFLRFRAAQGSRGEGPGRARRSR